MKPHLVALSQVFLAVLLLVQLGLTSYATSLESTNPDGLGAPKSILFTLGNTVWSIATLAFISIAPLVLSYALHNLVALFLLAITTVVWMGATIAAAAVLGHLYTTWRALYLLSQPIVAFSFFIWAAFAGLMSLEVLGILKGAYRNDVRDVIDLQDMSDDRVRYGFR